jgi:aspartate aminotransferase-like enzyme
MYIRKQRLLTPGPTPLYPPALHAMMASDIHHRTEDFRKIYRSCLADLKEVMGTAHDLLMFAASGTGAMDAAVSNLFSKGDKVIVCSAGKFGERWAEIAKAYGLDATVLTAPYGDVVTPQRVEAALAAEPATKGVFVQASETSTGAMHDVEAMGRAISKTGAIFVVDAITGFGTMPIDIDGWGLDVAIGGSQKAFMIPPGLAFMSVSPKAWKLAETATLPHYYFNLKK